MNHKIILTILILSVSITGCSFKKKRKNTITGLSWKLPEMPIGTSEQQTADATPNSADNRLESTVDIVPLDHMEDEFESGSTDGFFDGDTPYKPTPRRLYRLTKNQLVNSLNLAFNVDLDTDVLGSDSSVGGFRNNAESLGFSDTNDVEALNRLIDEAFPIGAGNNVELSKFVGCSIAEMSCTEEKCTCLMGFFGETLNLLYRRGVGENEVKPFTDIYKSSRELGLSEVESFKSAIRAILISPEFIFRYEVGQEQDDGEYLLTTTELLSRAAIVATDRLPASEDLSKANIIVPDQGQFSEYVIGLLRNSTGNEVLKNFLYQWFQLEEIRFLEKDTEVFPSFNADLSASMSKEVSDYLDTALTQEKLTLGHILGSKRTKVDATLAQFYGLPGAGEVDMPSQRKGIITTAGFLAANGGTSATVPTRRGSFILSSLLCRSVPGAPGGVDLPPPATDAPQTTRQRFADIPKMGASCAGCHTVLDPIGFGLESFAADGSYRTEENGLPVDTAAVLKGMRDGDRPFNNAVELVDIIESSLEVHACAVRQAFRYSNGRLERDEDEVVLARAYRQYKASGWDIRVLLMSLLTDYRYQRRQG